MTERRREKSPRDAGVGQDHSIRTFLVLTFTFSSVFYALMIVSGHVGGGAGRYATGIMWCPGLAALVTCRIHAIRIAVLGWQWAGFRYQAASYLLPAVYALVAYAVIWGTDLGSFPNPTFLRESVAAVGIDAMPVWAAVMLMVLLNAVYGFIRSCANALGEEIGWRGFLTPTTGENTRVHSCQSHHRVHLGRLALSDPALCRLQPRHTWLVRPIVLHRNGHRHERHLHVVSTEDWQPVDRHVLACEPQPVYPRDFYAADGRYRTDTVCRRRVWICAAARDWRDGRVVLAKA